MLGQLGAPIGFMLAGALFLFLHLSLSTTDFLEWGWRYPFFVAFAVNVVALFARLRLVLTEEYTHLLEEEALEPIGIIEMFRAQGYNLFIGAFAALASYALFHLVTVFPLSWIALKSTQTISNVLIVRSSARCLAFWVRSPPACLPTVLVAATRWVPWPC
jgi:MFS family permease